MKEYNLFISHAWKYNEDYYTVEKWLKSAKENEELIYKNYSVPQHDPLIDSNSIVGKKKLKEMLKTQIRPSSAVIIISGMYANYSEWIDFEIETAISMEKYIIGLKPWGQQHIPTKIQNNSNIMIGWNSKPLIEAIKISKIFMCNYMR